MTFLELQDLTVDWLDDVDYGYFTKDKVKKWVNNGQRTLQKLLIAAGENWYLVKKETDCIADQAEYALPNDFLKSRRVCIVNNPGTTSENETQLTPITTNEQDFFGYQAAYPQGFYFKQSSIVLLPPPDDTYKLRLYYSYRVSDMVSDSDLPDGPEEYHELCAIEAALTGYIKDGRDPSALLIKRKDYVDRLEKDAENRVEDAPRSVVETDSY